MVGLQDSVDQTYSVCSGQSVVFKAKAKDLKEANLALTQAKDFSDRGSLFEANVIFWLSMVVVTVTDASFANETIQEPDGTEKQHRTQKAFMVLLVDPKILTCDEASCHIWCWRSLTDKRVCRATLQGEAHM